MNLFKALFISTVLVVFFLCTSCEKVENDLQLAQVKVDEFRLRVRAEDYGGLYDEAGSAFRNKVSRNEMKNYISPFRSEIGSESRKLVDWKIGVNANVGQLVVLYYASSDDGQGLNEEFIFAKEETEFRLLNYRLWSQ
jgi:hypothetical protein